MRAAIVLVLLLITPASAAPLPVCDEIEGLLGTAGLECSLCSGYRYREPKRLTEAQIQTAVTDARLDRRTQRCRPGRDGVAQVEVTITPSGETTRAVLVTSTGGLGVDRCLMAAARRVVFPATDAGDTITLRVRY